jgi:hypothetical protein
MTADETTCRQPNAFDCAMPGDSFESVLGARRSEPAARRQQRRYRELVPADERGQAAARKRPEGSHRLPSAEYCVTPGKQLRAQQVEPGGIRLTPSSDHEVPCRLAGLNVTTPHFPEPPAQTIPGHRRPLKLRDDESQPRVARLIVHPDQVQVFETAASALSEAAAQVGCSGQPMRSRQTRRCRQDPPCFEGNDTARRFRPFFRRRDNTARPQRVAIRARNPCLLIRRLFRGR